MVQDDLKNKIKKIGLWTFTGVLIYLIVSFFLKSSYPITHHKLNFTDAYEVLKDALTLAAAYLAPITAFVLFNDWRSEHHIKSIYCLLDQIKILTNEIETNLKTYMHKIYHPERLPTDNFKNPSENLEILNSLANLRRLFIELKEKDQSFTIFFQLVDEFGDLSNKAKGNIEMMDHSSYLTKKYNETLSENEKLTREPEIKFHHDFFAKKKHEFEDNFSKLETINQNIVLEGERIKKSL